MRVGVVLAIRGKRSAGKSHSKHEYSRGDRLGRAFLNQFAASGQFARDIGKGYCFLGTSVSSAGIETDVVKECFGGWVPFFIAPTRISIAIPVSGGM
jgi:hypothetical protein